MWDSCSNNLQQSSPRTKYTIEPPLRPMEPSNSLLLIEIWLFLWNPQTKSLFNTWVTFDYNFGVPTSLFDNWEFFYMAKLRVWLWYHVRNHDSPQWYNIVHFENKLSWLCFWASPKGLIPMEIYSLLINPWSTRDSSPNNPQKKVV